VWTDDAETKAHLPVSVNRGFAFFAEEFVQVLDPPIDGDLEEQWSVNTRRNEGKRGKRAYLARLDIHFARVQEGSGRKKVVKKRRERRRGRAVSPELVKRASSFWGSVEGERRDGQSQFGVADEGGERDGRGTEDVQRWMEVLWLLVGRACVVVRGDSREVSEKSGRKRGREGRGTRSTFFGRSSSKSKSEEEAVALSLSILPRSMERAMGRCRLLSFIPLSSP
jgi:hypothetical protein